MNYLTKSLNFELLLPLQKIIIQEEFESQEKIRNKMFFVIWMNMDWSRISTYLLLNQYLETLEYHLRKIHTYSQTFISMNLSLISYFYEEKH